ncbi:decaprenyl-phosphate phosphoribosyltransferase [Kribbella amoyensis]|uniref:Decaprenyl-phosphate phosphoribosyltransferase n=1 Tax=Kribbella amoyensis TaxID=996641 RepID=A0A561C0K4_9ACTN|nr:decaprenyl-phosphate phosphoribosyltransferase [Kribbella amoyensis]TWD84608.1 decaprenyl-phosphate phosphoribosyltransferase [Kribbella amoyensis]
MTELRTSKPRAAQVGTAGGLLRLSRPRQWHKAAIVFAAPAAAGALTVPAVVLRATLAGIGFVLLAASIYAVNDLRDAPDDRRHPRKWSRPVAAGAISPPVALAFGVSAAVAGLIIAGALGWATFGLAVAYLLAQGLYVLGLKHVAVVDLMIVALGFVLRAAAGATATGLPVSQWFLLVSLFGAMFLVTGKRKAEYVAAGNAITRPVLAAYSVAWLDQVLTVSLVGTAFVYGLWAFQYIHHDTYRELLAVSFLPFLTGLLRYALLVSTGRGEEPERELFRDRVLLAAGLTWVTLLTIGLYLA